VPKHIAIVMDGNGRWANQRGLSRIEGHKQGEAVVVEAAAACVAVGVQWLSLYAFSTENWRRSPEEVRFLMGFSRDVIRHRTGELKELGVRIHWAGRSPRLWRSVINVLQEAEDRTQDNTALNLALCVNYGGRAEIGDAARRIAHLVAEGKLNPDKVDERTLARHMYFPEMPDVDLFIRPGGEQRTSNFMLWQSAYAELVFQDVLWPDFNRTHLWAACETFVARNRRLGGAVDTPTDEPVPAGLDGDS
jgi:undecaprenyl diphosphate synthase